MMRSLMTIVDLQANNRDSETKRLMKRRRNMAIGLSIIPIIVNILQTIVLNPIPNWQNELLVIDYFLSLGASALRAGVFGVYGAVLTGVIVDLLLKYRDGMYKTCRRNTYTELPEISDHSRYTHFFAVSKAMAETHSAKITTPLVLGDEAERELDEGSAVLGSP